MLTVYKIWKTKQKHFFILQKYANGLLTSRVLVSVGDQLNERVGSVAVQVVSVPRFFARDHYARLGEHIRYGGRDLAEVRVVRVGVEERHLWPTNVSIRLG